MSRANPRPKRAGEQFARTHYQDPSYGAEDEDDDGPSTKKPRFDVRNPSALAPDAQEEDIILGADEIGKRGNQTKRSAVNIDGYDSDSSNEGFDGRAEAKAKEARKKQKAEAKSAAEEQADMFADLDEDGDAGGDGADGDDDEGEDNIGISGRKKGKKNVRFLAADEIDGQVASSKSGGHVSADFSLNGSESTSAIKQGKRRENRSASPTRSTSSSEAGDSDRASIGSVDAELGAGSKKQHAPRLDAFNMKNEQEEGRFDDQGNFVRKAVDPDAVHDSWLEGVSKKDVRRAREAAEKREDEEKKKRREDDDVLTADLLGGLLEALEEGETALEALARLNRKKPKVKKTWQKNNKAGNPDAMDTSTSNELSPKESDRLKTIETISASADALLTRGQNEIYDLERESLQRLYKRETGDDWQPRRGQNGHSSNGEAKMYEYRWADARDGGETHGPYAREMMRSWQEAGYFGEGVEFREVGGPKDSWNQVIDFV